jgi:hypothetical protein
VKRRLELCLGRREKEDKVLAGICANGMAPKWEAAGRRPTKRDSDAWGIPSINKQQNALEADQ